jgi:hypothetical protein
MARKDVAELYGELRRSGFSFVPRGERHMDEVYAAVSRQFPRLCDDSFLCADNCSQGHQQPEWRHATRKALWSLKSTSGSIHAGQGRGFWRFT